MRRYPMESWGFVARLALNGNVLVDVAHRTPSWRAPVGTATRLTKTARETRPVHVGMPATR